MKKVFRITMNYGGIIKTLNGDYNSYNEALEILPHISCSGVLYKIEEFYVKINEEELKEKAKVLLTKVKVD